MVSLTTASKYGIFEFTVIKSVVSMDSISVISFARDSGCLLSSINNQVVIEPIL